MADSITQAELKAFVRRIESVDDEINALNSDKSEIYKEAKSGGFDTKILRKVVAKRRIGAAERDEQDAVFDLYWDAIHDINVGVVRAHVENIEEFDDDGVEIEPQSAPQAAQMHIQAEAAPNAQSDVSASLAGAEGIVDQQPIQPETENEKPEAADIDASDPQRSVVATREDAISVASGDDQAGKSVSASAAAAPVQSFKPLRPHCLKPEACGGSGKKHCWSCAQAMSEAGEVA